MKLDDLQLESDADVGSVERAIKSLEALPVVKFLFPIRGARPGVQAQLWCVAAHGDRREAKEQAQTTRDRKMIGCLEHVHSLVVSKHTNQTCIAAAEAAIAAAASEEAAAAGPSAPTNAFAAMAAAAHVGPAAEKAAAAEGLASEARAKQRAAEVNLEAANKVVEAAEAEARRLEEEVRSFQSSHGAFS
uniref:Uncharacterized protein n=1 Tax=Haptolina brevifila TaxID=156173 RepID=A0A7S2BG34_9EUKA|mmetsp:Transcript_12578/g.25302  ORF Transcript_12578/g.25302 Transcript_12578/m.25302 type:complete len:189 (+) Transcript_12578:281-847(+)